MASPSLAKTARVGASAQKAWWWWDPFLDDHRRASMGVVPLSEPAVRQPVSEARVDKEPAGGAGEGTAGFKLGVARHERGDLECPARLGGVCVYHGRGQKGEKTERAGEGRGGGGRDRKKMRVTFDSEVSYGR
jgi:hypothetical protein